MSRARSALIGAVLAAALSGCALPSLSGAGPAAEQSPPAVPIVVAAPDADAPDPREIVIPAIGARSSLISTGLDPEGRAVAPPLDQPLQASWFSPGPEPGEIGPAAVYGHVNGGGQQGIFARLTELVIGDEIRVGRVDDSLAVFRVTRVEQHVKTAFPTDVVYGPTVGPELRLVTCGGPLGPRRPDGTRSYEENVIIFAVLDRIE